MGLRYLLGLSIQFMMEGHIMTPSTFAVEL